MALLGLKAEADDTAALTDHECDVLWRKSFGGKDDVALILPIFIIYKEDAPAIPKGFNCRLYAGFYCWRNCVGLFHFFFCVTIRL